eukprot:gene52566-51042_t
MGAGPPPVRVVLRVVTRAVLLAAALLGFATVPLTMQNGGTLMLRARARLGDAYAPGDEVEVTSPSSGRGL